MLVWVVLAITIGLIIHFIMNKKYHPESWDDPKTHIQLLSVFVIFVLGFLAILLTSGKFQFLLVALGAIYPVFIRARRSIMFLKRLYEMRRGFAGRQATAAENMSMREAITLLGLKENYTKDDVEKAYKQKMKEAHPDQGGSTDLASKLNQARDLLTK